jgi:aminobenzoyl-glutamate transport protein
VPNFRLGTMIAMTLPLAAAFYVVGMVLTAVWVGLGIPVGPAAPVEYHVPGLQ